MAYSVIYEKITDCSMPDDFYYAHIPSLDLTTHGQGIDGARNAATELITLWVEEKMANHENVPLEKESFFSIIDTVFS